MQGTPEDLLNTLIQGCQIYADLLAEYSKISFKVELSDEESDRLEAIYGKAAEDPLFNFFINEFDGILNHRLGLLSFKTVASYEDQQSWLREHLEQVLLDREYREEVQQLLKELGVYKGPIDGVLGKRSNKAIRKYHQQVQEMLREKGFYNKEVDGVFGEYSVEAVRQFQKSSALREDGVPGRQTFSALKAQG